MGGGDTQLDLDEATIKLHRSESDSSPGTWYRTPPRQDIVNALCGSRARTWGRSAIRERFTTATQDVPQRFEDALLIRSPPVDGGKAISQQLSSAPLKMANFRVATTHSTGTRFHRQLG
jgi:hypothetical protein